jgi:hypothetical protein
LVFAFVIIVDIAGIDRIAYSLFSRFICIKIRMDYDMDFGFTGIIVGRVCIVGDWNLQWSDSTQK